MLRMIRTLASLAVVALLLAACPQNPAIETDEDAQTAPRELVIVMTAESDSGQDGTATLTELDGQTMVVVELSNAPADVEQPVHIHDGTCGEGLGEVAHALSNLVDGRSETTVDVSLDDLLAGTFAINAHKSAAELDVYVSCGNIEA